MQASGTKTGKENVLGRALLLISLVLSISLILTIRAMAMAPNPKKETPSVPTPTGTFEAPSSATERDGCHHGRGKGRAGLPPIS